MGAGIPLNVHEQIPRDDTTIIIIGPNGQIQMGHGPGGVFDTARPTSISPDETQEPALPDLTIPPTAVPITQVSPTAATEPAFWSQDVPSQSATKASPLSASVIPIASVLPSTTQPLDTTMLISEFPTSTVMPTSITEDSPSSAAFSSSTAILSPQLPSTTYSQTSGVSVSRTQSLHSSLTISLATGSSSFLPPSSIQSQSAPNSSSASSSTTQSHTTSSPSSSEVSTASSTTASSTTASSTISEHPTETVIAPPLPADTRNLNVHNPPFYVGIALGTIAGIAILAALIAWWIRLLSHRRRRARTVVPWGRLDDNGELEAGHGDNTSAAISAMNLGSREDLAHVQAWSPRGDRDVGEPRRAADVNGSTYSLHDHHIPGHNLFSDQAPEDGNPSSALRPNQTFRHLPSHLIDNNYATSAHPEEGFTYSSYNGHPLSLQPCYGPHRESATNPRTMDLKDGNLNAPWIPKASGAPPRSMAERLRSLGKQATQPPWEALDPLPAPNGGKNEPEHWGASLKTSLVNAFNSVAANISGAPRMDEDDKLTAPPKRMTRRSINDDVWEERKSGGKDLFRNSSTSTTNSKPWSLEEIGSGMGVVHLHAKHLDEYHQRRPSIPEPTLSFGAGDHISSSDDHNDDFCRVLTAESQIPLIASSKPEPALIKPVAHSSLRRSREDLDSASRESSMYSTRSAYADRRERPQRKESCSKIPLAPSDETLPSMHVINGASENESHIDSVVIQPDTISRLSSSDSSILPGRDRTQSVVDMAAADALKERQRRAMDAG